MRKFIIIAVILVIAGAGIYFGVINKDKIVEIADNLGASPSASPSADGADEPNSIFLEPVKYGSLKQVYDYLTFSFKYSDGFKVSSSLGAGKNEEVVTIENEKGSGFQIFIMPWDEAGPITPERIWQDMPEADVLEPKNADLDGSATLVFYGYNGDIGETFEAWTVRNKRLYQITGPKTAEDLIIETLETWSWK